MSSFLESGQVVVHPLVMLSVVDHYARWAKGTTKRVVGALLGEMQGDDLHVTNSFALPFEEDPRDPIVWFLDHNYLEQMIEMTRKVNRREKIIGWYSTGPRIKPADLEINELFRGYTNEPVLLVVDVQPKALELPMDAYFSVQEATSDKVFRRTFKHLPSSVSAYEAEELAVEHLLRDINNQTASTLATKVGDKVSSLKALVQKLHEISKYLDQCSKGELPVNHDIISKLQDIFNLLPDHEDPEVLQAFQMETNDMTLSMYLGSILRSTLALHNLINNKL